MVYVIKQNRTEQNAHVMLCKPCNTQYINYWTLKTHSVPSHVLFNQTQFHIFIPLNWQKGLGHASSIRLSHHVQSKLNIWQ